MANSADYCKSFYDKCGEVLISSLDAPNIALQNKGYSFLNDYQRWIENLSSESAVVLYQQACREYESALLSLSIGQYRQAFFGLRLCLELSLSGILFSSSEIELRTWILGKRDILWSEVMDMDKGVFSAKFTRAFFEDLLDERANYKTIAEKVYRECSEFVHGNFNASSNLPSTLIFDQVSFQEWHEKARIVKLVVIYAFTCRYFLFLKEEQLKELEHIIIDQMGHIPAVRMPFGGTVGG